ncbi:CRISPR-associated endoribonuclease Cas2 [Aciduliprofundum sp. MAR08-339]|uniref:CRISPR-associated endonuclease Cas2 n=1 Tax=Aciduliprofundum sp. (strain MAR08-339) TaxID=673860 RepID=UPI0002A4BAC5|nr:CRISPR-associated endoribonuclease Cas2 [Aciduliprofundum sp. MAR08-339]
MYVIVVYDIAVERIDAVRKYLKKYLFWKQNSVFEGELTRAEFERVKMDVRDMIDISQDYVIFYILRDEKQLKRFEMGEPKVDVDNVI